MAKNKSTEVELVNAAILYHLASLRDIKAKYPKHFAKVTAPISEKLQEVQVSATTAVAKKPRHMSAAARKRIAAAQHKRWAEYHRQKEATTTGQ